MAGRKTCWPTVSEYHRSVFDAYVQEAGTFAIVFSKIGYRVANIGTQQAAHFQIISYIAETYAQAHIGLYPQARERMDQGTRLAL
jgi:hypothetical protein